MSDVMTAALWRRMVYFLSPQFDIYAHLAPHLKGLRVLEAGFGTGVGVLQLARYAFSVYAIDVDPEAVAFAERVFPSPKILWEQQDISTWRPGMRFEAVTMIEVLEHIPDYKKALENISEALFPGRKLYMTFRNANADLRPNTLHEREMTAAQLTDLLKEHFDAVELYDWRMERRLDDDTRQTPLVAVTWRNS